MVCTGHSESADLGAGLDRVRVLEQRSPYAVADGLQGAAWWSRDEQEVLLLGHAGPDELIAQLPGDGQDLQVDLVRQLWRVDSPFTEGVLQALARSASPGLSKAARKALFSFRSAGKG